MNTINISLPDKLRQEADKLIKRGHYASFSDLTRTAIRKLLRQDQLDIWLKEAKKDIKNGKAIILESQKDIDSFINRL